jgi:Amt family ammonium transporter
LLDDANKGNANLDDLFLRKIRKKIKHATVASGEDHDFYLIDNQLMILGTFITVIGWAMLNSCGSGSHNMNTVSGRFEAESAFLNTFIAGSFSSFFSFFLKKQIVRSDRMKIPRYDIQSLCNGYLAGVSAVSAGSGTMKPWGALVTGTIASFLYIILSLIARKSKFDDPLENFQVYASAGFWGMIASAFFIPNTGVLWGASNSGNFLGVQFLSLVIITVWAILVTWVFYFPLKKCKLLRLKTSEEVVGHDTLASAKHKGIDISLMLEAVGKMYPSNKRKGC